MKETVRIRTLIADDDSAVRDALGRLIDKADSLELVGVAEDAQQAIELARSNKPDVALLDVKMPGGGPRAAREIRACSPRTAVLAFTAHEDERSIREMLAAGACSYLVKGTTPGKIVEAIQASANGGTVLSGEVAYRVVSELASRFEQERQADQHSMAWEERIGRVLSGEEELAIVFQPIVDLGTGRIVGLEELARFTSEPVRSPDVWFAEAALVGRSFELEMVAVEAAIASLDRIPPDVFLSVNVSPEAIASPRLGRILDPIPRDRVVLEITEHAPIKDYPKLRNAIMYLRSCGVGLAVDDAGAGYASLRHILQLMPDFIKLDIAITRGIDTESSHRALAKALVAFAREIEATIIAEGVETLTELATLRSLGATLGQGFYLGEPGALPGSYVVEDIVERPHSAVAWAVTRRANESD